MIGPHQNAPRLEKGELAKVISLIFDLEDALRAVRKVLETVEYGDEPHKKEVLQ